MSRSVEDIAPRRPVWFWWLLVNLLALCFAVLSWTLDIEVFGRPEVPRNYQILKALNRLPKLESYVPKEAPDGRLLGPEDVYGWFFRLGDERFRMLNGLYRRNFLRNYDGAHAVTYVRGDYEVLRTRPFGDGDFLPKGFAIEARALVKPDDFSKEAPYPVVIELLMPTEDAGAESQFPQGARLTLEKAPHLPVVMDVGRHVVGDEPVVRVTLMPIGYGTCRLGKGKPFMLTVPEWVRPLGSLPVFTPNSAAPVGP